MAGQFPKYSHWNRFPLLTKYQCICLLIGVDPEVRNISDRSKRARFDEISALAHSHQLAGSLSASDLIDPNEFIDWAKSMGEEPYEDWQPIDPTSLRHEKPNKSLAALRFEEALCASIEMKTSDSVETPKSLVKDVIPYMRSEYIKSKERFRNCCESAPEDPENLARSIRNGGGNPLTHPCYEAVPDVPKLAT